MIVDFDYANSKCHSLLGTYKSYTFTSFPIRFGKTEYSGGMDDISFFFTAHFVLFCPSETKSKNSFDSGFQ